MTDSIPNKLLELLRRDDRNKRLAGALRYLLEDFALLEAHRRAVAEFFAAEQKRLDDRFEAELASLTQEQRAEYDNDHFADEIWLIETQLPRMQWYAQFLVVFGTAEAMLNKLCDFVQRRSQLSVAVKDMHGMGIERAALYLSKVVKVTSPFQAPAWQRAKLLAEIRNAIAHKDGELRAEKNNPKSLYMRVQGIDGLVTSSMEGDDTATIIINSDFVRDAIRDLRAVLTLVADYELYPSQ